MIAQKNGKPKTKNELTQSEWFDGLRSDWIASKRDVRTRRNRPGTRTQGTSGDYHYRNDNQYYQDIELYRDLERNDPLIGQGIRRLVSNIVGPNGFTLDVQSGDAGADKAIQDRFEQWAAEPDEVSTDGEADFISLQHTNLVRKFVDGDIIPVLTRDKTIQAFEAHTCKTPSDKKSGIAFGVELSSTRRRNAYWFLPDPIEPSDAARLVPNSGTMTRIPTRQRVASTGKTIRTVLHIYDRRRTTQTRGTSALAPIVDPAGFCDDINFAKLVQQQAVSCYTIIRERELEFKGGKRQPVGEPAQQTIEESNAGIQREDIETATEVNGQPGERITGFSPQVPNPGYLEQMILNVALIAVNLDIPGWLLLLNAQDMGNFSSQRQTLDQARLTLRQWQKWYAAIFHRPVYIWKLHHFMEDDPALKRTAARRGSKFDPFNHTWVPSRWPYIEPLKDASADLLRVRNGLTSRRRFHAEHGVEWTVLADELVEDNALAIGLAIQKAEMLNKRFPDNPQQITWRDILALPMPEGTQLSGNFITESNDAELTGANANA